MVLLPGADNHRGADCRGKQAYGNRMAVESALATARSKWWHDPRRNTNIPIRVYRCDRCGDWHITSSPAKT